VHIAAISSTAPGTSCATRRIALTSWVTVSWGGHRVVQDRRVHRPLAPALQPGNSPLAVLTCHEDEFFETPLDMVHIATSN
jgi:hypothetical protein